MKAIAAVIATKEECGIVWRLPVVREGELFGCSFPVYDRFAVDGHSYARRLDRHRDLGKLVLTKDFTTKRCFISHVATINIFNRAELLS